MVGWLGNIVRLSVTEPPHYIPETGPGANVSYDFVYNVGVVETILAFAGVFLRSWLLLSKLFLRFGRVVIAVRVEVGLNVAGG